MNLLPTTLIAILVGATLDWLWIATMGGLYQMEIGHLLAPQVFWPAAVAFYLLFGFATAYLAVRPALQARSVKTAVLFGAFLGLLMYGTYDLTNLATLAEWPLSLTGIDLLWGITNATVTATVTYLIAARRF